MKDFQFIEKKKIRTFCFKYSVRAVGLVVIVRIDLKTMTNL